MCLLYVRDADAGFSERHSTLIIDVMWLLFYKKKDNKRRENRIATIKIKQFTR